MSGFFDALYYVCTPGPLGLVALGTALGIIVGAVPGLTGAMLISLTLPLTFAMQHPPDAMALLVSMYVGSVSGGLVTATLLRMPGTPASIVTTLDGYPLAQQGAAGRALGLGVTASLVGGLISWFFLLVLAAPVAAWSTKLGPFDFFSLVLMALVLIASVSGGSLLAGLFSGFLGILATMPGLSPATGQPRLTFGYAELNDGFKLLPVLIGLFAVGQIIDTIVHIDRRPEAAKMSRRGMFMSLADWRRQGWNLVRSSLIGTWVGVLPGIGANIGSLTAYSATRSLSRAPEKFGHGAEEGIVASEAANNATIGGALIPLVAMGVPGSVIDAILLGGLVIHGLQPGPLLFSNNPEVVYTIVAAVLVANLLMFAFMFGAAGWLARVIDVPRAFLIPAIMVFCVIGSYALGNRAFDIWVMLAFGLVGYGMDRLSIPLAPFVIGFVLAPVGEENLSKALMLTAGSWWEMFDPRTPSLYFFLIALALFLWPLLRRKSATPSRSPEDGSP